MVSVIGDLLPLAIGIAISPLSIIAAILMILSPRAHLISVPFLVGWIVGVGVTTAVFIVVGSTASPGDPNESKPVTGVILLLLGGTMLYLAWRQWRGRPRAGEPAERPGWMNAIDHMSAARAFGFSILLSALTLKNVMYEASAGVVIGNADLSLGSKLIVLAIFVVLASVTVGGPIIAYSVAPDRFAAPLESVRRWLEANNATIMTIVLFLIGVDVVGKGLSSF